MGIFRWIFGVRNIAHMYTINEQEPGVTAMASDAASPKVTAPVAAIVCLKSLVVIRVIFGLCRVICDIIEFHKVSYREANLEASDLEKRFVISVGEIW